MDQDESFQASETYGFMSSYRHKTQHPDTLKSDTLKPQFSQDDEIILSMNPKSGVLPYGTPEPLLPTESSQRKTPPNDEDEDEAITLLRLQSSVFKRFRKNEAELQDERRIRTRERDQANRRILELEDQLAIKSAENADLEARLRDGSETIASLESEVAVRDVEITAKDAEVRSLKDMVEVKSEELAKAVALHTEQQQRASSMEISNLEQQLKLQWAARMADKEIEWLQERTEMETKLRSVEEELRQAKEVQRAYPEILEALIKMEDIYLKHVSQGGPLLL
ncbi:hypothetical protein FRC00_001717 [Tulasnella sp. 408]|nr:hypothetical protein FRC00_001717 [Tulasnella sp. 408]